MTVSFAIKTLIELALILLLSYGFYREQDIIRVHPIITKGGDLVNNVPADVRMELYVRAATMEAIDNTHKRVDAALKAGGDAVGAQTIVETLPGMLPLHCCKEMNDLFVANVKEFSPETEIVDSGTCGNSITWTVDNTGTPEESVDAILEVLK